MFSRRFSLFLAAAALGGASLSCSASSDTITLQGAGATFPAPLYKRWFLEYYKRDPEIRVNYQAIGSGAGIRQFTEGLTKFGASDASMSKDEVDLFKTRRHEDNRDSDVLLLPVTAGSIVLCYNLPGMSADLKLFREAYLKVFLGEITQWNDPLIARANPDVVLPDMPITVVRRAEGSGTTYVFTKHLDAVGKQLGIPWKFGVNKSSSSWQKDTIGARGNPGVAALVQQTPGSIGYLEFGYADLAKLPTALLENKAGNYVRATPETSQEALAEGTLPSDFRIWITDPGGKDAYPIVTYTWLLCYTNYHDAKIAASMKQVLRFCLTEGQRFSAELGYIPLPPAIADRVLQAVARIGP
jgi:phosphate transport system substrate-binding protein